MKLKNIFSIILSILLFTSCATTMSMVNADNKIKKVKVGMTQEEVIQIMGNSYQIIGSKQGQAILGYEAIGDSIYKLVFIDGILIEWTKEWLPRQDIHKHHIGG